MNWIWDVVFFTFLSDHRCKHPLATTATRPHAAITEPSRWPAARVTVYLGQGLNLTALPALECPLRTGGRASRIFKGGPHSTDCTAAGNADGGEFRAGCNQHRAKRRSRATGPHPSLCLPLTSLLELGQPPSGTRAPTAAPSSDHSPNNTKPKKVTQERGGEGGTIEARERPGRGREGRCRK